MTKKPDFLIHLGQGFDQVSGVRQFADAFPFLWQHPLIKALARQPKCMQKTWVWWQTLVKVFYRDDVDTQFMGLPQAAKKDALHKARVYRKASSHCISYSLSARSRPADSHV